MSENQPATAGDDDVRAIKISAAGERYVRARSERRRLERERNSIECERVAPVPDEAPMPGDRVAVPDNRTWQQHPCWRWTYELPDEGFAGGWGQEHDSQGKWCESCRRRQLLHGQWMLAGREIVAAFNSLRRAVTGSRS